MPDPASTVRAGVRALIAGRPAPTAPVRGTADALTARGVVEPRNFLQGCVLLLLRERPAHGYELLERLKAFGIVDADSGNLYRKLRSLEEQGMVHSRWETSEAGPRRRMYHLTEPGNARLRHWADSLAETRRLLDYYLGRHALVSGSPAARPEPVGPYPERAGTPDGQNRGG